MPESGDTADKGDQAGLGKPRDKGEPQERNHRESPAMSLPPEAYEELPSQARSVIQWAFRSGSWNPLLEKFTEAQWDEVLGMIERENVRRYEYAASHRWFQLAIFAAVIVVFVFLVIFLSGKPNILAPMLTAILGFGAGFGVGKKV